MSAEVATGVLASFSQLVGGLTGMYVVYVLAVGSFARSFTTNLVTQIPYAELPSTHRLTALCEDIYAMRHAREFALEERLSLAAHSHLQIARGALRIHENQERRRVTRAAESARREGRRAREARRRTSPTRWVDRGARVIATRVRADGRTKAAAAKRFRFRRVAAIAAIFDDVDSFVGILASYYARREGASFVLGVHTTHSTPPPAFDGLRSRRFLVRGG